MTIPPPIRAQLRRRKHRLVAAASVMMVLAVLSVLIVPSVAPVISTLLAFLLVALTVRDIAFRISVPRLSEQWHINEELRLERKAEYERNLKIRAAEYARSQEEARVAQIKEYHSVLDAPDGSKRSLQTRYGEFWVTNCRDGSIRLWWPPFGRLREHAVQIVRGKGGWARDVEEGWFVPRANARYVLTELASL